MHTFEKGNGKETKQVTNTPHVFPSPFSNLSFHCLFARSWTAKLSKDSSPYS